MPSGKQSPDHNIPSDLKNVQEEDEDECVDDVYSTDSRFRFDLTITSPF